MSVKYLLLETVRDFNDACLLEQPRKRIEKVRLQLISSRRYVHMEEDVATSSSNFRVHVRTV